ncbi:MAG: hypothetical protein AB7N76_22290 [Planctomycetota bacterium]
MALLNLDYTPGPQAARGQVVAAPHDGYDTYTGTMARDVSRRLDWGLVVATGYRSYTYRHWFDVNRPTERPWQGGDFGVERVTARGRQIYADYLDKLRRAGNVSGRLSFLVELHGNARTVSTGHGSLSVEAIELATQGFTLAQLQRLKARYAELVQQVPPAARIPLQIDRLDQRYAMAGYLIPFYFYASGAKDEGSLESVNTERALHFELPPAARNTLSARSAYGRLLADLVREAAGY